MKKLILFVLILPIVALADPQGWMKYQVNPDQLYVIATSSPECPVSSEKIEALAKNVVVRSRIKPLDGGGLLGYPYLKVTISCLNVPQSPKTFAALRIDFVSIVTLNSSSTALKPGLAAKFSGADMLIKARLGEQSYAGSLLIADEDFLVSAVSEYVENFMVDYLRANFDLGEDE